MEQDIQHYLEVKNMIPFTTGLDISEEKKWYYPCHFS